MARRKRLPDTPFDATIERLTPDGSGVLHHDDNRLKAFGALPGEVVSARYRFGRSFRGQAEVIDIKQAAAQRATPQCPVFGTCGGCALQHMEYAAQLAFKQELLHNLLDSQAHVQPARWLEPLTAGAWGYRRKARLSVRDVPAKGKVLVGFREQDSRFVTDLDDCKVLDPRVAQALPALQELVAALDARKTIPQIEVACGDEQVALVIRHLEPLSDGDPERLRRFAADTGFILYLQAGGPTTVTPLEQDADLRYHLDHHDLEFRFGPMDFIQVNAGLNQMMIDQAMEQLHLQPQHRVLDLFCGLGNFSLPLARHCREVIALEGDAALVQRAADNATHNGIDNVRFQAADLYAGELAANRPGNDFDRILLDPPRSGALPLLGRISESRASRVVYVSCNPETLAHDAGILVHEHGFMLEAAGIMDMFPHTAHVESMAVFSRS